MKKLVLIIALALASGSIFAQEDKSITTKEESYRVVSEKANDRYKVETNRFWSNWFLGIGGGAQMYFGDHNRQMNFKDRLTPAFEGMLGKWFSPGIGVRAMYSGRTVKGVSQNGSYATGKVYDTKQSLKEQQFNYAHIHGDVLFNITNIFGGYKEKRFWNISPYLGLGMMFHEDHPRNEEVSFSIGLFNGFRLSKALDITLDVRGSMINDRFDGELGGRKQEGILSAALGLSYKFKKRDWDRSSSTIIYDDNEIYKLRELLDQSNDEINKLRNNLANRKDVDVIKEKIVYKTEIGAVYVNFKINNATLSKDARINLGFFANLIKQTNSDYVYVITGYADSATGSKGINDKLSKQRAQAVYDCLVNEYGVPAEMLKIESEGGVGNMFYDSPELSRAVITKAAK